MKRGAVSIKRLDTGESRDFLIDTSFPPLRREAFRRKSIPAQRESINLDNIAGQGTISTEGAWRREMIDFSGGAGQYSLDRRDGDVPNRFFSSKGIDVFSVPQQVSLLPDTHQVIYQPGAGMVMARCQGYIIHASGSNVYRVDPAASWAQVGMGLDTTYGGSSFGTIYSMTTNDQYVFMGTSTGIWFSDPSVLFGGTPKFQLFAAPDPTHGSDGFGLVRWANDQLIAGWYNTLYAFQPRSASSIPAYGQPPSAGTVDVPIQNLLNSAGTVTLNTQQPHGASVGQQITIAGTQTSTDFSGISLSGHAMTVTTAAQHGFSVGEPITVTIFFTSGYKGVTETTKVTSVASGTQFTYTTTLVSASLYNSGFVVGYALGSDAYGYNSTYTVLSTPSSTQLTFAASTTLGPLSVGGSVTSSASPDVLWEHPNPHWYWTDATGGSTQIYFSGFNINGNSDMSGCIYRSDLIGSSVTSSTGTMSTSPSSVAQPSR